jgi:hypothetical protein
VRPFVWSHPRILFAARAAVVFALVLGFAKPSSAEASPCPVLLTPKKATTLDKLVKARRAGEALPARNQGIAIVDPGFSEREIELLVEKIIPPEYGSIRLPATVEEIDDPGHPHFEHFQGLDAETRSALIRLINWYRRIGDRLFGAGNWRFANFVLRRTQVIDRDGGEQAPHPDPEFRVLTTLKGTSTLVYPDQDPMKPVQPQTGLTVILYGGWHSAPRSGGERTLVWADYEFRE